MYNRVRNIEREVTLSNPIKKRGEILARNTIQKKMKTTHITVGKVTMNEGMPEISDNNVISVHGSKTLEQAQRYVRQNHGNDLTVFDVDVQENTYVMDMDEFMKQATILEEQDQ